MERGGGGRESVGKARANWGITGFGAEAVWGPLQRLHLKPLATKAVPARDLGNGVCPNPPSGCHKTNPRVMLGHLRLQTQPHSPGEKLHHSQKPNLVHPECFRSIVFLLV